MWTWLKGLFRKPTKTVEQKSFDEFGDHGLSDQARADIDRLRESKGWGVRPTKKPPTLRSVR